MADHFLVIECPPGLSLNMVYITPASLMQHSSTITPININRLICTYSCPPSLSLHPWKGQRYSYEHQIHLNFKFNLHMQRFFFCFKHSRYVFSPPSSHHIAGGECILYSRADWILDEILSVASHTLMLFTLQRWWEAKEREREMERRRGVSMCDQSNSVYAVSGQLCCRPTPWPPQRFSCCCCRSTTTLSVITGSTKRGEQTKWLHIHPCSFIYIQWLYNIIQAILQTGIRLFSQASLKRYK